MNKQNLNRNISSILQKPNTFKMTHQNSQLSFRHLTNKSLLVHEARKDSTVSPITTKRNKTITNKLQMSAVNTEPSESLLLNANNNNLVEAFQMERQSMVNTLKMYKEQVEMLTKDNNRLKDEVKKCTNRIIQRDNKLKDKIQDNQEMVKKVKQYESMLPKIIELETLQENVIKQNNILKNKIKIQESLLSNVVSLARTDHTNSPVIEKILTLTQCFLNNSIGSKSK